MGNPVPEATEAGIRTDETDGSASGCAAVLQAASTAASRLFRAYEVHSRRPDHDTLFNTLNSLHSLNDRLKKADTQDFEDLDDFTALKALRNFAHHQDEITANVRVIAWPGDLAFLCLVRRSQVEGAIEATPSKWRPKTRSACELMFHWYGDAVNINPCLFNFMVHAYERLGVAGVTADAESVRAFKASYDFETSHDFPHFIDGRLSGPVGEIGAMLSALVIDLPDR